MKKIIPLSLMGVALTMAIMPYKSNVTSKEVESNRIVLEAKKVSKIVPEKVEKEQLKEEPLKKYTTRMTSYYPEEGETTTGSGLGPNNFEVNDKGWFTYQGKLVVATATTYLANQGWYVGNGVHLRKYYNEITLTIDGVDYRAIVLDSCGNCMRTDRVDLYVSSVVYAKDTMIEVKE